MHRGFAIILIIMLSAGFCGAARARSSVKTGDGYRGVYPAGGSTDIGARVLAGIAEKELGQPMLVLNKAGAGGQVGWTELTRQKPDGYYIGFINLPAINCTILDPGAQGHFRHRQFYPHYQPGLRPWGYLREARQPLQNPQGYD